MSYLRPRTLWTGTVLGTASLLLWACGAPEPELELAADVVASFNGGQLVVEEVEALLRSQGIEDAGEVDWNQRYEQGARTLAVEKIVEKAAQDSGRDLEADLGDQLPRLLCDVTLDLYLERHPIEMSQISPEDIEAFYEAERQVFERPEQRMVWHLFLRHQDPEDPEATAQRLEELRRRALEGESFRQLAERYSESENRGRRGHLGWMTPGGPMPEALEKIVFAIEPGGISEVLPTPEGGILLHVSDVLPGVSMSFEEAQPLVLGRLRELAFQEILAEQVEGWTPRDGDLVLTDEALKETLATATAATELLRLGDVGLSFADLQELLPRTVPMGSFELISPLQQILETYRVQAHRHLLCRQIEEDGFPASGEDTAALEQHVREASEAKWMAQRIEDLIWEKIDRQPETLRRFYDDNQHLFQSPLQMLVDGLSMPLGEHPVRRMQALETLRQDLVDGRTTFEEAQQRTGVEVIPQRWVGPGALVSVEPKILVYLTQLGTTGYTVPFQQNKSLQLLRVVERREPEPLGFESAQEQVSQSYYDRFQQELYGEVVEALLSEAGFQYRPEVVVGHLDSLGLGADGP